MPQVIDYGTGAGPRIAEHERRHLPRPTLSVVVPCYNEEESLRELHGRLVTVCSELLCDDFEIVLIDDGSRDRTWPLMAQLAQQDERVTGVRLTRNFGHQLALSAGLEVCRGERILIIDADLQDPPELLPEMMRLMDGGAEVVYGQRSRRQAETAFKRLSAALFYRLIDALADVEIPRDTGDFRLMSRRVLELLKAMPEQHRFIRGMISWIGLKQVAIAYERQPRFAGESHYPLGKMMRLAFDAVTGFSVKPLRLAFYLAVFSAMLGGLGVVYTIYSWLALSTVAGWTSVMTAVLILGSAQLLILGLIGEYIGRTYVEMKRRPAFLIDRVLRAEATDRRAEQIVHIHRQDAVLGGGR